jgi:hypothetical protein
LIIKLSFIIHHSSFIIHHSSFAIIKNMPMRNICLLLFLGGSVMPCIAQKTVFSEADMAFFQQKAERYGHWLEEWGLHPLLGVEAVRFPQNRITGQRDSSELELLLALQSPNPDTAAAQWQQLSRRYREATGHALEEVLFRRFVSVMEIPAAQGNVQVYARQAAGRRTPCFFVWAWDEGGVLRDSVLLPAEGCKAQSFKVTLPPTVTVKKAQAGGRTGTIRRTRPAHEVFDAVLAFARQTFPSAKYQNTDCSGRFPDVREVSRTTDELQFTVTELCREALTQGSLSTWCRVARATGWQKDCNDIRRERFEFSIRYNANADGSYTLDCLLRGKFGSAAYVPRSGDYFDMDPDFIAFEQDFAEKFKEQLFQYLK